MSPKSPATIENSPAMTLDASPSPHQESLERNEAEAPIHLGQWVLVNGVKRNWVKETQTYDEEPHQWFGCVVHIGSNFVKVEAPKFEWGRNSRRIHFDDIWSKLVMISDEEAKAYIADKVDHFTEKSMKLIEELNSLSSRLGLNPRGMLSVGTREATGTDLALSTMSAQSDLQSYKNALIESKDTTIPDLFKEIKKANLELAGWLGATTLSMQSQIGEMKSFVTQIEDRVFNIGLYAGFAEDAVKCCDGEPATVNDKLHVMQRRCYMDEECLANYQAGGMTFEEIHEFDAWISEPENRDRILPFPRTVVAMRVRRHDAEREWDGSIGDLFNNLSLKMADKFTYLYIRNGDQVWRVSTEIDFGHMIFPDRDAVNPLEPMMVKMFGDRVDKFMPVREFEHRVEQHAIYEAWIRDNPYDEWKLSNPGSTKHQWNLQNPHRNMAFNAKEWTPVDHTNIYYDEAVAARSREITHYNRIATVIQGLFDRSEALHPHLPVHSWKPESFAKAIELVYDANHVLTFGDEPDFNGYIANCNAEIGVGSVVIGQEQFWLKKEAEKEMRRRNVDFRLSEGERYREFRFFRPYDNPGPDKIARVEEWKPRSKKAQFSWNRNSRTDYRKLIPCSISVPATELFNISAYRPGDFKQFFQDPRSREKYIKWAPFLMAAEDWWMENGSHKDTE